MEQATQQIAQKPPFPIKTKIAAWLLMFQGVSPLLCGLLLNLCFRCIKKSEIPPYWAYLHQYPHWIQEVGNTIRNLICGISGGELSFGFFFFILLAFFLLWKKKWAWWLSALLTPIVGVVLFLSFAIASWFQHFPPSDLLTILIPLIVFILLLLDRKNFFKIAS